MQCKACCNNESFHALSSHERLASHSSLGSSQSVRLQCGKGNADRRGPRSFEHAMQGTCCNNESGHALSSHEWLASHSSLGSSQSVRLNCGTGNVDRRGAATQGTDVANCIGPFHAPASRFSIPVTMELGSRCQRVKDGFRSPEGRLRRAGPECLVPRRQPVGGTPKPSFRP